MNADHSLYAGCLIFAHGIAPASFNVIRALPLLVRECVPRKPSSPPNYLIAADLLQHRSQQRRAKGSRSRVENYPHTDLMRKAPVGAPRLLSYGLQSFLPTS
jgi:hypothetical protein